MHRFLRVLETMAVVCLLAAYIGPLVMLGACAPTTTLDLSKGTYSSPKDIQAKKISVKVGPDTKEVQIEGLDSSASTVIAAQAEAMRAQAEAAKAWAEAIAEVAGAVRPPGPFR